MRSTGDIVWFCWWCGWPSTADTMPFHRPPHAAAACSGAGKGRAEHAMPGPRPRDRHTITQGALEASRAHNAVEVGSIPTPATFHG